MDDETLRGIVSLILLVVGGAGLWIYALYHALGRAKHRVAALETECATLERRFADLQTIVDTRYMSDGDLLSEVDRLLGSL